MPRFRRDQSLNDVIENAVAGAVARIRALVDAAIERMASAEVGRQLVASAKRRGRAATRRSSPGRRRSTAMTRWVTDKRARRVPTFVIEATGLDTKKKIVARFGEYAVFEKGKPLPKPTPPAAKAGSARPDGQNVAARIVRAKPPIVRKGAALRRAM